MQKTRNSSLELLKIIALIFIVLTHASPFYGDASLISFHDFNVPANNIEEFIMLIIRYFGHFGNLIFIICSSYFLINNSRSIKKAFPIIIDTICIYWITIILFNILKIDISAKDTIKALFPITFELNWFITCYLIFYFIHPLLNFVIEKLNKQSLLKYNFFFTILYVIIQFAIPNKFFYSRLIGFVIVYFFTAYLKLYLNNFSKNKKVNITLLIVSFICHILLILLTNVIGGKIGIVHEQMMRWYNLLNPFTLIFCFSLFNIFNSYKFENKAINYISSLSLLFYVIHENYLFKTYVRPLFYQKMFAISNLRLIWILVEALLLLIGGIIVASLYKQTIQKVTLKISERLYIILKKIYKKIEKVIIKIN